MVSLGGGGGSEIDDEVIEPRVYEPKYRLAQREWVTPPADVISQQYKDIGEQEGYGFGNRNLFGSGIMGDAIARRIGESAVRSTRREDKGNYIFDQVVTPSTRQEQTNNPKWGFSVLQSGGE